MSGRSATDSTPIAWAPQAGPQFALFECPLPLIFYGGARGGGKTDGVLGKWAAKAEDYGAAFNALALRRTTVSFEDALERAKQIYRPLGAKLVLAGNRPTFRFPDGGRISFRYLENAMDAQEYQGRNVTDVWVEEAGQYPDPKPLDRMFGVLRSAEGVPTQMILTANPGGPGQIWLRERFNLHPLPQKPTRMRIAVNEATIDSAVIPARLKDNPALYTTDPEYANRLKAVGSAELVKAWLEGDWSAVEGAFFDCWSSKMIIRPMALPDYWTRFMSMDWGYAAPFSVGWWAVASEDLEAETADGETITIPRKAIIRYREWYGCVRANEGLRMDAEVVGRSIVKRSGDDDIRYGVLDPSAFASDSGPSIAERLHNAGAVFRRADNRRVGIRGAMSGWDQMRARMVGKIGDDGEPTGQPMIYCFSTCEHSIRTIPMLPHDPDRAEDLDTEAEDHAADEWRYGCMSRPMGAKAPEDEPTVAETFKDPTFDEMRQRNAQRLARRRKAI